MAQVKIANGKAFATGIKYARQVKGVYDPATKIWTLPDTPQVASMLAKAAIYGLVPVRGTTAAQPQSQAPRRAVQPCPRCHTYCYGDCQQG